MNALLTIEQIVETFYLEDVTEDTEKLAIAFAWVADAYAKFSSSVLAPQEVYHDLCDDIYQQHGLVRTFLLMGYNPSSGCREPLGTLGMIIGAQYPQKANFPPFESMRYVCPPGGWSAFQFENFNPEKAIEFRRFAISPACRQGIARTLNLHMHVINALFEGIFAVAVQRYGQSQAWLISLPSIVKILAEAGVHLQAAPAVSLNQAGNQAFFAKYDKYWLQNTPHLYKFIPAK